MTTKITLKRKAELFDQLVEKIEPAIREQAATDFHVEPEEVELEWLGPARDCDGVFEIAAYRPGSLDPQCYTFSVTAEAR